MTLTSFIIILFIFVMAGLIVMRPFLDKVDGRISRTVGVYDSLLAERERLLSALEDLDLDLELKKISPAEHGQDRNSLLAQAADVLKELDRVSKPKSGKKAAAKVQRDDDLEKMIRDRRRELQEQKAIPCSSCGKSIDAADQFCSHCGKEQ